MKIKALFVLTTGGFLALAAWWMHEPAPAQADPVPEKYRETVNRGLEYLVSKQHPDGHWESDGGQHPVAMTSLVGLALLMEFDHPVWTGRSVRHTRNVTYAANIRKAADWLMENSKAGREGLIFSEHASETARYMEGHGLATLFLAGVARFDLHPTQQTKLTADLTRAVKYIVKAQSSQGGWHQTSKMEGHDFATVSATVIQIQALQAAEIAGVPVPSEIVQDAQEYVKKTLGEIDELIKPGQNPNRQWEVAAAIACRTQNRQQIFNSRKYPEDPIAQKWLAGCSKVIPVGRDIALGRDELTHFYYAQGVFSFGGDGWRVSHGHVRPSAKQPKEGWELAGERGTCAGTVYATALWCAVLQLDKKSHPTHPHDIQVEVTTRCVPWPRFESRILGEPDEVPS